jgi:hypothetical protein
MAVETSNGTAEFVLTNTSGDDCNLTFTPAALDKFASVVAQARRGLLDIRYRAGREIDSLAITVVLTRFVQVISGTILALAEHQADVGEMLGTHLSAFADEAEWVSEVVRRAALVESETETD